MRLVDHKIEDIPYRAAHHIGGPIVPTIVVLHDTAGRLEQGNSANHLRNNSAGVSVHFVIERDGSIEQQVPTNRRAGHAGTSSYHGCSGCNDFSIGIEIVNPGRMDDAGRNVRTWWGGLFSKSEYDVRKRSTREHGSGWWMGYTFEQIDAVIALLSALFEGIDTLVDVRTHWYVSPGRKVDTNPLFPLERIRARILGRDDVDETTSDEASEPVTREHYVSVDVPNSALNMRRWPSFNPNVLTSIPDETVVPVLRAGVFGGRRWLKVLFNGREGWVVEAYTASANPAEFRHIS